ncbi:MAG: YIP1 family protein [Gemmatimonadetes bacterium]|nr:YIP1 family protein [Gemmatimonadota bacterium]
MTGAEAGAVATEVPVAAAEAFPWPPPPDRSILDALFETWRRSVFEPGRFFTTLPPRAGLGPPLLYYLLIGIASAGLDLFWRFTLLLPLGAGETMGLRALGIAPEGLWPVVEFLLSPLFLLVVLAFVTLTGHALLALLGGAHHGLNATARVFAFAYGPQLFAIVPLLGNLVGAVWMVVIAIIGLARAHRTDGWRAALAVLLPIGIVFFFLLIAFVFLGLLMGVRAATESW